MYASGDRQDLDTLKTVTQNNTGGGPKLFSINNDSDTEALKKYPTGSTQIAGDNSTQLSLLENDTQMANDQIRLAVTDRDGFDKLLVDYAVRNQAFNSPFEASLYHEYVISPKFERLNVVIQSNKLLPLDVLGKDGVVKLHKLYAQAIYRQQVSDYIVGNPEGEIDKAVLTYVNGKIDSVQAQLLRKYLTAPISQSAMSGMSNFNEQLSESKLSMSSGFQEYLSRKGVKNFKGYEFLISNVGVKNDTNVRARLLAQRFAEYSRNTGLELSSDSYFESLKLLLDAEALRSVNPTAVLTAGQTRLLELTDYTQTNSLLPPKISFGSILEAQSMETVRTSIQKTVAPPVVSRPIAPHIGSNPSTTTQPTIPIQTPQQKQVFEQIGRATKENAQKLLDKSKEIRQVLARYSPDKLPVSTKGSLQPVSTWYANLSTEEKIAAQHAPYISFNPPDKGVSGVSRSWSGMDDFMGFKQIASDITKNNLTTQEISVLLQNRDASIREYTRRFYEPLNGLHSLKTKITINVADLDEQYGYLMQRSSGKITDSDAISSWWQIIMANELQRQGYQVDIIFVGAPAMYTEHTAHPGIWQFYNIYEKLTDNGNQGMASYFDQISKAINKNTGNSYQPIFTWGNEQNIINNLNKVALKGTGSIENYTVISPKDWADDYLKLRRTLIQNGGDMKKIGEDLQPSTLAMEMNPDSDNMPYLKELFEEAQKDNGGSSKAIKFKINYYPNNYKDYQNQMAKFYRILANYKKLYPGANIEFAGFQEINILPNQIADIDTRIKELKLILGDIVNNSPGLDVGIYSLPIETMGNIVKSPSITTNGGSYGQNLSYVLVNEVHGRDFLRKFIDDTNKLARGRYQTDTALGQGTK